MFVTGQKSKKMFPCKSCTVLHCILCSCQPLAIFQMEKYCCTIPIVTSSMAETVIDVVVVMAHCSVRGNPTSRLRHVTVCQVSSIFTCQEHWFWLVSLPFFTRQKCLAIEDLTLLAAVDLCRVEEGTATTKGKFTTKGQAYAAKKTIMACRIHQDGHGEVLMHYNNHVHKACRIVHYNNTTCHFCHRNFGYCHDCDTHQCQCCRGPVDFHHMPGSQSSHR